VDVLRELAAPDQQLFFLTGADIMPELPRWHAPKEILELATLVVVNRPGAPSPDLERLERQVPGASARVVVLKVPGIEISSSELRARVKAGQPIRYLTPPKVEAYILEHGLYA
jgi:nicotinate-nucleotide adenylyltransferase